MAASPTTPDLPVARWAAAARTRRSRRRYDDQPVGGAAAEHLAAFCSEFSPFEGAQASLLVDAPARMFTGWLLGMYGKVSSPSALVFAGDRCLSGAGARAGYTGEAAVLEATALGLDTCWIGGGVRRDVVASALGLDPHLHVYSIAALGYARERATMGERATSGMVRAHKRRHLATLAPNSDAWPGWARAGVQLARIAPSATNRQPWRFALEDDDVVRVFFEGRDTPVISKHLDCGIAMLHFELGAREAGGAGEWELLPEPDVARWIPHKGQAV